MNKIRVNSQLWSALSKAIIAATDSGFCFMLDDQYQFFIDSDVLEEEGEGYADLICTWLDGEEIDMYRVFLDEQDKKNIIKIIG